jgi:hypothetical protein
MNFQAKVIETTSDLRARVSALAGNALDLARASATDGAHRAALLKGTLSTLRSAGGELNKVARRHVSRLVEQNSSIVVDAGKDLTALAKVTYTRITAGNKPVRKPRKSTARKRTRKAA